MAAIPHAVTAAALPAFLTVDLSITSYIKLPNNHVQRLRLRTSVPARQLVSHGLLMFASWPLWFDISIGGSPAG